MRTRAVLSMIALALGASACTEILGIDERSLRDDTTTDKSGSQIGGADGGAVSYPDASEDEAGVDPGDAIAQESGPATDGGPSEPPSAFFSTETIDFGQAYCGAAGSERSIRISNKGGDGQLDWTATLGPTSVFSIKDTNAGQLDLADSFAIVTIVSTGVPAYGTAGDVESTTLTITVIQDGAAPVSTDIPVTQTAAGAMLVLEPPSIGFGQVQTGSTTSAIPIMLQNTGNMPISVGFGASGDPQLALVNGTGTILAPTEELTGLAATFAPKSAGSASTRIAILPGNTPICGAVPTGIDLSGTGTVGPIAVQPGSLDFGLVDCAKQATAQQIQITTTGAQLSWTASLGKGSSSPYVISPSAGSASSAAPGAITVTPRGIPQSADVTADAFADTLTIVAPDGSHSIPLHETAHGAILTQSTSSVSFGGVSTGTKATSQFNVVNLGNASATVSYKLGDATFAISPQAVTVGGQGSSSLTSVSFSPAATSSYSTTATMTVPADTVLCSPLPTGIALSGTGTKSYASVSPTTVDFGLVPCSTTGAKKTVTVSNTAPVFSNPFSWTATLGKGSASPFKLSSSGNSLSGGGSSSIDVTPVAIPAISSTVADAFADTLTITTTALNDSPHVISLHETAQGAILAFAPTALSFGSVTGGTTATQSFQLVNDGNYPASKVALTMGNATYFSLAASSNITVNGGSSTSDTATFKPSKSSSGVKSTTVTPIFTGPNCGGAPTPLTLSGTSS